MVLRIYGVLLAVLLIGAVTTAPQDNSGFTLLKPLVDIPTLGAQAKTTIKNLPPPVPGNVTEYKLESSEDRPSKENLSQSEEKISQSEEKPSQSEENLSQPEEKQSQSEENLSQSEENLSQSEEKLSQSEEKLSQSEEKLSQSEEKLSQSEESGRHNGTPLKDLIIKNPTLPTEVVASKKDKTSREDEIQSDDTDRRVRSYTTSGYESETTDPPVTERDVTLEDLILQTEEYEARTRAPTPRFLSKLSYFEKHEVKSSVATNLVERLGKRRFKSKCRCEKIWNCPKLQITVPRCPNEYFLCCF